MKIDFHVLRNPLFDRSTERLKTIESLRHPLINIIEVDGYKRHIGKGRYDGFSQGTNEYVSFADDDDVICSDVIERVVSSLDNDQSIDGVFTEEIMKYKNDTRHNKLKIENGVIANISEIKYMHHLVVIRRSSLQPFLGQLKEWPDLAEVSLYGAMIKQGARFQFLKEVGYIWKIHKNNARSLDIVPCLESVNLVREIHGL